MLKGDHGTPEHQASASSELARAAALLKFGLLNGYTTVAEAVAWADARIEADAQPHSALLEVSTSGMRSAPEVAAELDPLAAGCRAGEIVDDILSMMYLALSHDRGMAMQIASALYRLTLVFPTGEDRHAPMVYLEDSLDLARQGIGRTEAEVITELLDFLRPFRTATPV